MTVETTLFEIKTEKHTDNSNEVIETKPMGNITKVIFASGAIEYHMFDSQVGSSRISAEEGVQLERTFDENQRALAIAALNAIH